MIPVQCRSYILYTYIISHWIMILLWEPNILLFGCYTNNNDRKISYYPLPISVQIINYTQRTRNKTIFGLNYYIECLCGLDDLLFRYLNYSCWNNNHHTQNKYTLLNNTGQLRATTGIRANPYHSVSYVTSSHTLSQHMYIFMYVTPQMWNFSFH